MEVRYPQVSLVSLLGTSAPRGLSLAGNEDGYQPVGFFRGNGWQLIWARAGNQEVGGTDHSPTSAPACAQEEQTGHSPTITHLTMGHLPGQGAGGGAWEQRACGEAAAWHCSLARSPRARTL